MKIVAVVQARMGSSRFPSKMMQTLGAYPIIEWVLTRVKQANSLDGVILATSTAPENDVLGEVAHDLGIQVMRGDENDVLSRFLTAAKLGQAQLVVRVCADNPFVSAEEIDRLVAFYEQRNPDYAFNHIPRLENSYPDGLGAEVLSYQLLEQLDGWATAPRHREHVTLYLWEHASEFTLATFKAPRQIAFPKIKLDVDTKEDLERLRKLECVADINATAEAVVNSYRNQFPD